MKIAYQIAALMFAKLTDGFVLLAGYCLTVSQHCKTRGWAS